MSQPAYPSHVSPKTVQIPNQCTHISFIPLLLFRYTKIVNWNTRVQYMISLIIINLLQTHRDTGLLDYCNRYEEKCFTKKSTDSLLLSSLQILPGTPTEEINSLSSLFPHLICVGPTQSLRGWLTQVHTALTFIHRMKDSFTHKIICPMVNTNLQLINLNSSRINSQHHVY